MEVNKETNYSASAGKIGWTNHFPADEVEEYRKVGGCLPAVKPGRYVHL